MKKCKTAEDLVKETLTLMQTDEIYSRVNEAASLDYAISAFGSEKTPMTKCNFDTSGYVNYGTSEGIYGNIVVRGNWCDEDRATMSLFTYKSLSTDRDVYLAIGVLVALFSYYADKVVGKWIHSGEID